MKPVSPYKQNTMLDFLRSGLSNVIDTVSGIGSTSDPSKRFSLAKTPTSFRDSEIIAAYTGSGLIQKIIEFLPNKARQATFTEITPEIETGFNNLQVLEFFKQASISARLFKESYLIINIDDGLDINEPINLEIKNNVFEIYLIERDQITFKTDTYQNRIIYELKLEAGKTVEIHPTRVLCFYGKYFPAKVRAATKGFHGSIIDGVLASYSTYSFSLSIAASLLARMVTFVFKMKGLRLLVKEGKEKEIQTRLNLHKQGIGSVGGLIIDADSEDIDWLTFSLAGIAEIINVQKDAFTAHTELSHDVLWNEGSHSTSSDVELTNTAEKINEFIECFWEENLNILASIMTGTQTTVKLMKVYETKEKDETGFNETDKSKDKTNIDNK